MALIVTYLWHDPESNIHYTADDVRRLYKGIRDHADHSHEFAVVTDKPELFEGDEFRAIKIDETIPRDAGHCVVKLMIFHPEGKKLFGAERVFQMDLDTLVVGDVHKVLNRLEDVVLWRNPARIPWDKPSRPNRPLYNGSFLMHKLETLPRIWLDYQPGHPMARNDQLWCSFKLGPDAPYWDSRHGLYRLARPGEPETGVWGKIPENAVMITCPGSHGKPDSPEILAANPWLQEYDVRFGA